MNINKKIINTISEIVFLIILIVITNITWDNLTINQSVSTKYINKNSSNLELNIKEFHLNDLYPTNLEQEINNNYIELEIQNSSNNSKYYVIYLIIEKSELNIDYMKIKINNNTRYLNELEKITIKNKIYYTLEENISYNNSIIDKKCYIWLAEETPNSEQNKNLQISFKIDEI